MAAGCEPALAHGKCVHMTMVKVTTHGYALKLTNGPGIEVSLERGAQHVDKDMLDRVFGNPRAKMLFDAQCQSMPAQAEGKSEDFRMAKLGEPDMIVTLTTKAAQALIATCEDRERLKKWAFADARAEVRKALHLRDRALLPGQDVAKSVEKD